MGYGMSFKIAPGVRLRPSSRGLRVSVGPRAARVHFGAGRTTVSSGAGPVTVWAPAPGHTHGGRPRGQAASLAAYQRQSAAAARAEQIAAVRRAEHALCTLHHQHFPPAERPIVPPPSRPDVDALVAARRKQALEGLSLFAWSRRRAARRWAQQAGQEDAARRWQEGCAAQAAEQGRADAYWRALLANDPETVRAAMERAFEDNRWPAACVGHGVEQDGTAFASVAMIFGPVDLVPERKPALTPSGKPTLHKRTKTERNEFYSEVLGSTVLATVKEGFAVAPGVAEIHLVAVRKDPQASSPDRYLEAIYAARFPRDWTRALPWQTLDPAETLLRVPDAQLRRRGSAHEIVGLDLSDEPGISDLLELMRNDL